MSQLSNRRLKDWERRWPLRIIGFLSLAHRVSYIPYFIAVDQSFPYECLLMVDNCRYMMELYKETYISESESDCDTNIDKLEGLYFGIQNDGFHDSFM